MIRASGSVKFRCAFGATTAFWAASSPFWATSASSSPLSRAFFSASFRVRAAASASNAALASASLTSRDSRRASSLGSSSSAFVFPEAGVLDRVSIGEQSGDLIGEDLLLLAQAGVTHRLAPRRVRPHLRPIEGDLTQRHHPGGAAEFQRLHKHIPQTCEVPFSETVRWSGKSGACW